MTLDRAACYRALRAHDARFDGLFYVGVSTTGIYCRPICPARTPGLDRCTFFERAAEAERAGFRACFRCRPELAPGVASTAVAHGGAPVDATARLVHRAAARIDDGCLNDASVDQLAAELGVTSRHLRRAMEAQLGVTPIELAQTKRLALAKHLLHETRLPLAEVAFAAGFASLRRFNALFQSRFGRPPSEVRRAGEAHARRDGADEGKAVTLRLDYRPPLAWDTLLGFLAARAIPGVERVVDGAYHRSLALGARRGWVRVRADATRAALRAEVSPSLAPVLTTVVTRLRGLFDLDARPDAVDAHLGRDPLLAPLVAARPGLRVPGAFDGFEAAVRAVLGQQVSVAAATTLSGRLVQRFGAPPADETSAQSAGIGWTFPRAAQLADASTEALTDVGITRARAETIRAVARAVARDEVRLAPDAPPEATIARLVALPGVGPWTAHYIALRALRWPDAFPAADLGVRKALGAGTARAVEARAAAWRPWRAYAVLHLWTSLADGG